MHSRFIPFAALALLAAPAHAAILGSDAAVCTNPAASAVLVRIEGFKARTGMVRVQVYSSTPGEWLAKGKKLRRIELAVTPSGAMDVCIAVPGPGRYGIAVRHDVDGEGKSGWDDGAGFSRNPALSLLKLKPDFANVAVPVGQGPRAIDVVLNYRSGFSIRPVAIRPAGHN
ncbi:DUF2141 domain-containing protein [Sphingomonas sp.]|uniref:DUF2141 domain-containing protein n=1 Tax=Sphingomonas sp. TaxID=28214 RepID=UPI0025ED76D2|nr:DUF2141 domain-containing protein [Sphingomonas sp.]